MVGEEEEKLFTLPCPAGKYRNQERVHNICQAYIYNNLHGPAVTDLNNISTGQSLTFGLQYLGDT